MANMPAQNAAGSEATPGWTIEMQPREEGTPPALLIVGQAGTVTIPLGEVNAFYNELMAAATRLAAIDAETAEREEE